MTRNSAPVGEIPYRCGYVAIVGRPNVGKSTLMNHVLGQKISITTRKPQTTRHRIHGIKTTEKAQTIYVDTPGIHRAENRQLNRLMNRAAISALDDVDVIIMVVEGLDWRDEDEFLLTRIQQVTAPLVVAVNKVDKIKDKGKLLPHIQFLKERSGSDLIVPLSAQHGENVSQLEDEVARLLPTGNPVYAEDEITDRSMRFLASEVVREKLMRRLGQELPYRIAVDIERFMEKTQRVEIDAVIWVERASQKGIVIGKQGHMLKDIGTQARKEMEEMFGIQVVLKLWVKVKEGWSENERLLRSLGLDE